MRRTPALALGARRALGEMLQEQFLSELKSRLREDDRLGLPSRIVNPSSLEQQVHDAPIDALPGASAIVDG